MKKPGTKAAFTPEELGLLIACAIWSLWLLSFWIGYDLGMGFARDYFTKQG